MMGRLANCGCSYSWFLFLFRRVRNIPSVLLDHDGVGLDFSTHPHQPTDPEDIPTGSSRIDRIGNVRGIPPVIDPKDRDVIMRVDPREKFSSRSTESTGTVWTVSNK
jgi:hypothetical protein